MQINRYVMEKHGVSANDCHLINIKASKIIGNKNVEVTRNIDGHIRIFREFDLETMIEALEKFIETTTKRYKARNIEILNILKGMR